MSIARKISQTLMVFLASIIFIILYPVLLFCAFMALLAAFAVWTFEGEDYYIELSCAKDLVLAPLSPLYYIYKLWR